MHRIIHSKADVKNVDFFIILFKDMMLSIDSVRNAESRK